MSHSCGKESKTPSDDSSSSSLSLDKKKLFTDKGGIRFGLACFECSRIGSDGGSTDGTDNDCSHICGTICDPQLDQQLKDVDEFFLVLDEEPTPNLLKKDLVKKTPETDKGHEKSIDINQTKDERKSRVSEIRAESNKLDQSRSIQSREREASSPPEDDIEMKNLETGSGSDKSVDAHHTQKTDIEMKNPETEISGSDESMDADVTRERHSKSSAVETSSESQRSSSENELKRNSKSRETETNQKTDLQPEVDQSTEKSDPEQVQSTEIEHEDDEKNILENDSKIPQEGKLSGNIKSERSNQSPNCVEKKTLRINVRRSNPKKGVADECSESASIRGSNLQLEPEIRLAVNGLEELAKFEKNVCEISELIKSCYAAIDRGSPKSFSIDSASPLRSKDGLGSRKSLPSSRLSDLKREFSSTARRKKMYGHSKVQESDYDADVSSQSEGKLPTENDETRVQEEQVPGKAVEEEDPKKENDLKTSGKSDSPVATKGGTIDGERGAVSRENRSKKVPSCMDPEKHKAFQKRINELKKGIQELKKEVCDEQEEWQEELKEMEDTVCNLATLSNIFREFI